MTDDDKIYVRFRGRTVGPLTSQKIQDMIRRGQITRLHELSDDGSSWSRADEFRDFFATMRAEITKNLGPLSTNVPHPATAAAMEPAVGSFLNPQPTVEPQVEWYAHVDDEHQGPMTLDVMRQWKESGRVQGNTLVWRTGLETWLPAKKALPDLFASVPSQPVSPAPKEADSSEVADQRSSTGLTQLAVEMDRRRGWATIFGIIWIILPCLMIVGHSMTLLVAASERSEAQSMTPKLISGILGIAFAVTLLIAAVLLLRYCGKVRAFAIQQNDSAALEAAQRLSAFWSFAGIASLVWLVVVTVTLIILVSLGVSLLPPLDQSSSTSLPYPTWNA